MQHSPIPAHLKAAIFDMDGLLIDSEPLWREAEVAVFTSLGMPLTHEECRQTMGLRIDEVVRYWRAQRGWPAEVSDEAVIQRIIDGVVGLIKAEPRAMPGVREVIRYFHRQGVRMCIASSSSAAIIATVVAALGLAGEIEFCHSAEHEQHGKPHPAVYLTALRRLAVPAHACIAFEDSPRGVEAAKAAGLYCVGIPDAECAPTTLRAHGADIVCSSLLGFLELIQG